MSQPVTGPTSAGPEVREARRLPYLPALDGLRTVALAVVLLGHGGVAWVRGDHFGVTIFFVLSGFLITALLVQERESTGRIALADFWKRRARRLVPASLLFFAFTLLYLAFGSHHHASSVFGDGIAALTWTANWRFVLIHRGYGDLFADPTPFAHLWSLAVEEQWYLALPLVATAVLWRRRGGRARLAILLTGVVAGSTFLAWHLFVPGTDPVRAYYGTDTRVAELAVGALAALLLCRPAGLVRLSSRWMVAAVDGAALTALVGIAWFVHRFGEQDATTYHGGLLAVALASAVVVVAATQPTSLVARALAGPPLPELGRLTYGAYLFHWPIYLWLTTASTGLTGPRLLVVRLGLTFAAAAVSHRFVEQPIREGRLPRPVAPMAWANVAVALAAGLVLVTTVAGPAPSSLLAAGTKIAPPPPVPPRPLPADAAPATTAPVRPTPAVTAPRAAATAAALPSQAVPPAAPEAPVKSPKAAGGLSATTSTTSPAAVAKDPNAVRIVVVGDSLANNLGVGMVHWAQNRSDVVAYNLAVPGCPISRGGERRFPDGAGWPLVPECGWWSQADGDRSQKFRAFDPDVVIVEDALNETADRKLPDWPDYRHPGDPRFDAWLLSEYKAAVDVFSKQGAHVIFANAPCADWSRQAHWSTMTDADQRVAALNRIYDNVVAATTTVADLFNRICPNGQYTDTVEGVDNARPDGFHLVDEAGLRLTDRWLGPTAVAATPKKQPL